ncbi:MAG: sulfotransferase, partial [Pseudomonadales bacterium]|nr:sulfotransferase [Pseudomonadales bacterium]
MFKKKTVSKSSAVNSSIKSSVDNTPFFILGCVRSGTTMLRDILKEHPRLECPEETHFFRWADPYGSPRYERHYLTQIFKDHRKLDKITNKKFHAMKDFSQNRKEISDGYGRAYLDAMNNPKGRWFDKTPQNIYGITMINYYYPTAKFIHIYRNPLNVVA